MAGYELVFIISPEVTDDDVAKTVDNVGGLVTRIGGSVTETSQWGRRSLAYPIKRFTEGNYVLAQLELEPASIKEVEADLQHSGEILRHLLIRQTK